ncbi:NF038129 family PEP-CTERM protein [Chitinimonas arctica]|uniref:NF038129 family PEP-CTERM protein n=1 Tax=Chitinimonas arctica TaxID=2594795 RepID=UPI0015D44E85|nr:NF038129 family PEP-CTERM protein [Chitinimonas arctica]
MKLWTKPLFGLFAALALLASAGASVSYDIRVDTSSLAGSQGHLDFGLIGLNDSPLAGASITGLSGGSLLGPVQLDGGAAAVAGGWALDNGQAFNAVFGAWQFGQQLGFRLTFSGDWQTNPLGSGNTFAFKLWNQAADATLLTNDGNGDLLRFELLPAGRIEAVTFDRDGQGHGSPVSITAVPEPETAAMLMAGLMVLAAVKRRARGG